MDEKDLFNRDSMYWREVNASLTENTAILNLNEPFEIEGEWLSSFECVLLPYESHAVEYEMDNGGAFKKNEVKEWPFVFLKDKVNYEDKSVSSEQRLSLQQKLPHAQIQSIQLKDKAGNVVLTKAKI